MHWAAAQAKAGSGARVFVFVHRHWSRCVRGPHHLLQTRRQMRISSSRHGGGARRISRQCAWRIRPWRPPPPRWWRWVSRSTSSILRRRTRMRRVWCPPRPGGGGSPGRRPRSSSRQTGSGGGGGSWMPGSTRSGGVRGSGKVPAASSVARGSRRDGGGGTPKAAWRRREAAGGSSRGRAGSGSACRAHGPAASTGGLSRLWCKGTHLGQQSGAASGSAYDADLKRVGLQEVGLSFGLLSLTVCTGFSAVRYCFAHRARILSS